MIRKTIAIIISLGFFNSVYAQYALSKIKDLNLNKIENEIITYYSTGFSKKAEDTNQLLKKSSDFFEREFNLQETFSIAILNENDWNEITPIPYGLPFVSGPPYVVCIPADTENELAEIVTNAIKEEKIGEKYDLKNKEVVDLFISMIGFHELGHMYAKSYSLKFPNKWIFEFTATYFAYYYLKENFKEESDIWLEVSKILTQKISPVNTSLKTFEEKYVQVGIANYAWYQTVFLIQVDNLYDKSGKDFLIKLKDHSWKSNSESEYINELDEISQGFNLWAEKFNLVR